MEVSEVWPLDLLMELLMMRKCLSAFFAVKMVPARVGVFLAAAGLLVLVASVVVADLASVAS
jgi:hypothetical protein